MAPAPLTSVSDVLAIYNFSGAYKFFGFLHIVAAIVAIGPLIVYPSLRASGDREALAKKYLYMSLPALTLTWVFGMGLVGMSDDAIEMSDLWIVLSLLLWLAAMIAGWFLIRPSIVGTDPDADKKFSAGVGITHLTTMVIVLLMVLKPGGGGL